MTLSTKKTTFYAMAVSLFLCFCCKISLCANETLNKRYEFDNIRMGVEIKLVLYTDSEDKANRAAEEVFLLMDQLNRIFSDYDAESEISILAQKNTEHFKLQNETPWLPISEELCKLLEQARILTDRSEGAFDITIGPCTRLWRRTKRLKSLPKEKHLEQAKALVGPELWQLNSAEKLFRFMKPEMKLDLGAIAKGYVIDRAFELLIQHDIPICMVDAGGDLRLGNEPPEGWKIDLGQNEIIHLKNQALATSGDSMRFVQIGSVRYSHILDPKTGLGLTRPIQTTVAAPTATEADALASAITVLGPERGLHLIRERKDISVRITTRNPETEETTTHQSGTFKTLKHHHHPL